MTDHGTLEAQFEAHRAHLNAVAYRILGSQGEADDAVQEAWLRLSRAGAEGVDNLGGWLTTVVARVCLDLLRSRTSRREEPLPETERRQPGRLADDGGCARVPGPLALANVAAGGAAAGD